MLFRSTDFADDPQFLGELAEDPAVQGGLGAVTAAGAVDHEAAEEGGGVGTVGWGKAGEAETAEVEGEGALLGEAEGLAERTWIAPATAESLGGGGKGEVTPAFAGIFLAGTAQGADGLDDLVGGAVARMEITDLR